MIDSSGHLDAASDEMIEFLRSENERLGNQVSDLRSEMALLRHVYLPLLFCSIFIKLYDEVDLILGCRSTKDEECIQYNKLLMEENQNSKV